MLIYISFLLIVIAVFSGSFGLYSKYFDIGSVPMSTYSQFSQTPSKEKEIDNSILKNLAIISLILTVSFCYMKCNYDLKIIQPINKIAINSYENYLLQMKDSIAFYKTQIREYDNKLKRNNQFNLNMIDLKHNAEIKLLESEFFYKKIEYAHKYNIHDSALLSDLDLFFNGNYFNKKIAINNNISDVNAYDILRENYNNLLRDINLLRDENKRIAKELTLYKKRYNDANQRLADLRSSYNQMEPQIARINSQNSKLKTQLDNFLKDSLVFMNEISFLKNELKINESEKIVLSEQAKTAIEDLKDVRPYSISRLILRPMDVKRRKNKNATYKSGFKKISLQFKLEANVPTLKGREKEILARFTIPSKKAGENKVVVKTYKVVEGKEATFELDVSGIALGEGLYYVQLFDEKNDDRLPIDLSFFNVEKGW